MEYPYRSILNPIQFDDSSLLALGKSLGIQRHRCDQ